MFSVKVDSTRCKGCQLCLHFCKPKVFSLSKEPNPLGHYPVIAERQEACSGCKACYLICPDCAVTVAREVG